MDRVAAVVENVIDVVVLPTGPNHNLSPPDLDEVDVSAYQDFNGIMKQRDCCSRSCRRSCCS